MSYGLNRMQIVGNLVSDPVQMATKDGKPFASLTVAVNEKIGNTDSTLYFRCTAWEKVGSLCMNYLHKGDKVEVIGRLNPGTYTNKAGETKCGLDINVRDIVFLVTKPREQKPQTTSPANNSWMHQPIEDTDELPY